jgi:acetyl esterase/lipase
MEIRYTEAYLPNTTEKDRRDPKISPFFADLMKMRAEGRRLPSALFTCGTADPLLDDSVFMCAKWYVFLLERCDQD